MWDLGMCKLSYHTGRRPESLKCSYLELDWMSMAMEAPDLAVSPGFRESTCGLSIPQSIWKPLPVLPASFPGPWQSLGLFENHQRHGAPRKEKGYLGNWKGVVWDSCWANYRSCQGPVRASAPLVLQLCLLWNSSGHSHLATRENSSSGSQWLREVRQREGGEVRGSLLPTASSSSSSLADLGQDPLGGGGEQQELNPYLQGGPI